jgi:hypothetical protein
MGSVAGSVSQDSLPIRAAYRFPGTRDRSLRTAGARRKIGSIGLPMARWLMHLEMKDEVTYAAADARIY